MFDSHPTPWQLASRGAAGLEQLRKDRPTQALIKTTVYDRLCTRGLWHLVLIHHVPLAERCTLYYTETMTGSDWLVHWISTFEFRSGNCFWRHSLGAVWKSRWPSLGSRSLISLYTNYSLCGRKATLSLKKSSGVVWKSRWPSWAFRIGPISLM